MHDLKGSIENLRRQLRALKFSFDVNFQGMVLGHASAFVDFYRHLLCDHNAKLTSHLVESGFGMLGTTDYRFMEVLYRILRDLLSFRPPITLTQFFTNGFAERKIQMATSVAIRLRSMMKISPVKNRSISLSNQNRSRNLSSKPCTKSGLLPGVSLHRSCRKALGDSISYQDSEKIQFTKPVAVYDQDNQEKHISTLNSFHFQDKNPDKSSSKPRIWPHESHNQTIHNVTSDLEGYRSRVLSAPRIFAPSIVRVKSVHARCRSSLCGSNSTRNQRTHHPLTADLRSDSYGTVCAANTKTYQSMSREHHNNIMNAINVIKEPVVENFKSSISCLHDNLSSHDSNLRGSKSTPSVFDQDTVNKIMTALFRLTGKVDDMLSRMGTLENRISTVENAPIFDKIEYTSKLNAGDDHKQQKSVVETVITSHDAREWNDSKIKPTEQTDTFNVKSLSTCKTDSCLEVYSKNQCDFSDCSTFITNHGYDQTFVKQTSPSGLGMLHVSNQEQTNQTNNVSEQLNESTDELKVFSSTMKLPSNTVSQGIENEYPIKVGCSVVSGLDDVVGSHELNRCASSEENQLKFSQRNISTKPDTWFHSRPGLRNIFYDSVPESIGSQTNKSHKITVTESSCSPVVENKLTHVSAINSFQHFDSTDQFTSHDTEKSNVNILSNSSSPSCKLSNILIPNSTKPKGDSSYLAQVERITNMLAETQNLLEDRNSNSFGTDIWKTNDTLSLHA